MKKLNLLAVFAVLAAVLVLSSCKKPENEKVSILGKWQMEKSTALGEEKIAPANTFFEFNSDGTFTGAEPFRPDRAMTGTWTLEGKILTLTSSGVIVPFTVESLTTKELIISFDYYGFGDEPTTAKVYLSK